jgi:hypothetical protein
VNQNPNETEPIYIPGSRPLFAATQARIDHTMASDLPDDMKLDAAFDHILQLGADLDRLARKQKLQVIVERPRTARPLLCLGEWSVGTEREAVRHG